MTVHHPTRPKMSHAEALSVIMQTARDAGPKATEALYSLAYWSGSSGQFVPVIPRNSKIEP